MDLKIAFAVLLLIVCINAEGEDKSLKTTGQVDKAYGEERINRLVRLGKSIDFQLAQASIKVDTLKIEIEELTKKRSTIKAEITQIVNAIYPVSKAKTLNQKKESLLCCPWVIWCCFG